MSREGDFKVINMAIKNKWVQNTLARTERQHTVLPITILLSAKGRCLSVLLFLLFLWLWLFFNAVFSETRPLLNYVLETCMCVDDRFCGGLFLDIKRKIPWYPSDFYEGFHIQSVSAVLFIYLGCITNAITFGGLLGDATDNYQVNDRAIRSKDKALLSFLILCSEFGLFLKSHFSFVLYFCLCLSHRE